MLGYLSADIICSEKWTVLRERSSRKTVCFEEQTMSKDKYPSIFSPKMEAIVFIILQIFFATCTILKIGEYSQIFPSFGWGIFGHVTCLDQLRASEKIWWIINMYNFNILRSTPNSLHFKSHTSPKCPFVWGPKINQTILFTVALDLAFYSLSKPESKSRNLFLVTKEVKPSYSVIFRRTSKHSQQRWEDMHVHNPRCLVLQTR